MTRIGVGLLLLCTALGCGETGPTGPVPSSQRQGLTYTADFIDDGPESLFANVTVANRGLAARTIRFPDPCVALFRFHDAADRLVWDQHPSNKTCVPPGIEITLQPGESRVFERFAYAPAILAFYRIPVGWYRIILYLRPDSTEVELELGQVELGRGGFQRETTYHGAPRTKTSPPQEGKDAQVRDRT